MDSQNYIDYLQELNYIVWLNLKDWIDSLTTYTNKYKNDDILKHTQTYAINKLNKQKVHTILTLKRGKIMYKVCLHNLDMWLPNVTNL